MNGDKSDAAAISVLCIFALTVSFAYCWDAAVKIGWLHAGTISSTINQLLEGQVSAAFLLGYLVCHVIRG